MEYQTTYYVIGPYLPGAILNFLLLAIPTGAAIYKAGFRWWWNAFALFLLLVACVVPLVLSAPNPAIRQLPSYLRELSALAVLLVFWLFALLPWPALRK